MQISRRLLLKQGLLGLTGLSTGALSVFPQAVKANSINKNKTLVCIFLRGGNDGLNTVVPAGDSTYYDIRPTIAVAEANLLDIKDSNTFGFHPNLQGFKDFYDNDELAIFPAAYNSALTLSHFDSQAIVNTGLDRELSTGWLARALNQLDLSSDVLPVVGLGAPHEMLVGNSLVTSFDSIESFVGDTNFDFIDSLKAIYAGDNSNLNSVLTNLLAIGNTTFDNIKVVKSIGDKAYSPAASYANNPLATYLQTAARLIKNSDIRAITIDHGGYDTHDSQLNFHPNLLQTLSDALAAFYQDLGNAKSDVMTLIVSEFGRTLAENGSQGTDHGRANSWFAIGAGVQGGIYGDWPGLSAVDNEGERYLAQGIDTQDIVSEILIKHMGVTDINAVFPGISYQESGFIA